MKKIIAIIAALAATFTIASTAYAFSENGEFIWIDGGEKANCYTVLDTETGVEYIVFYQNGFGNSSIGVCPRYNTDGSIYTFGVEENSSEESPELAVMPEDYNE